MARRSRDPKKVENFVDPLTIEIRKILSAYLVPLVSTFPVKDISSERSSYTYDLLLAANPEYKAFTEYVNGLSPDARRFVEHRCGPSHHKVNMAIWLPGVDPLIRVEARGYEDSYRAHVQQLWPRMQTKERSTNGVMDPVTRKQFYMDAYYEPYTLRSDTIREENAHTPMHAVLNIHIPMWIPDGKVWLNTGLDSWARMESVRHEVSTPSKPWGSYPTMQSTVWLLPDHPEYERWRKWAEAAYVMEKRTSYYTQAFHALAKQCTTAGQLKRVFPALDSFVAARTKAVLDEAKIKSAFPVEFVHQIGESREAFDKRMGDIRTFVHDLTALCTRAIIMPKLGEGTQHTETVTIVESINADGYAAYIPTGSCWNPS